ncbi:MAG: DNA-directed RNA polymerase subunit B [Candidatus Diapherotrites archaeon]|uniref:DNA-directed RNA polymerase subunit beta n=1 Tax=Candidatus Iainarchaeum sp. TaxID=3101447 RepID=A0A8T4C6X1_9ARCH|nr:DNA-directed RNA polymerase subunit B [Candidatus Diapherotrites archaeon]
MAAQEGKVFVNGKLVGFHKDIHKLTKDLVAKRRSGKIDPHVNIALHEDTLELYVNTDSGRVQRPVIVVESGKPRVTKETIKQVKDGKLTWNDLVLQGYIEYLDAEEEDTSHIALREEDIVPKTTHLEINPMGIFSVISSMIPFLEHNLAGKTLHGAKVFKQAVGIPAANYNLRTDTESYLLYYPQRELVRTKTLDFLNTDQRPMIQNFVVAIMPYMGFNVLDSVVLNKGAVDRGLGRAAYFRNYESEETRYPGGQVDKFEIPNEEAVGHLGEDPYKKLGIDGLAELEMSVSDKDVIIGKTSPPRFLEEITEFGVIQEKRREASLFPRKGKPGVVDRVILTEGTSGARIAKVKVRSNMIPEPGDKFASKHGQKGVLGAIIPEEDMPFTESGIRPDLILNPHAIPTRMTIGHMLEMLTGKSAALGGKTIDGTPFNEDPVEDSKKILEQFGFRSDGKEAFYDGRTGRKIEGEIYTGIIAYRRLFHMVAHKLQARSRGPVQILTRQPTEGKEKEGGLRFGEMEGETLVGHGAAMLLQEKFIDDSDKVTELVCDNCGVIAVNDQIRKKRFCPMCESTSVYPVQMSYGFKLLLDELKALGIYPKMKLVDRA